MPEIIQAQIGQCGNRIGVEFWKTIAAEHRIQLDGTYSEDFGTQYRQVFFRESEGGRYIPRTVLVDLEPGIIDFCQNTALGKFFQHDNFVCGQSGASNNYAIGYYTTGTDLIENVLDVLRKEAEACDCLQGFQITHCLGGGTGSGLTSRLVNKIRQEYPTQMIYSYSVVPSLRLSDVVLEAYNSVLSMPSLIEDLDMAICLDNDSLVGICAEVLGINNPTYSDINHLASLTISNVTACLRFSGQLNGGLRKLALNMLPFLNPNFLFTSFATLIPSDNVAQEPLEMIHLVNQLFDARNMTIACEPRNGVYITAAAIFRGQVSAHRAEAEISAFRNSSSHFVDWIPDSLKTNFYDVAPPGMRISASCLANNTAIRGIFGRLHAQFSVMFRRKAFLHWFTNEGMDEMDFVEARNKVDDLIMSYQQHEEVLAEEALEMSDDLQMVNVVEQPERG